MPTFKRLVLQDSRGNQWLSYGLSREGDIKRYIRYAKRSGNKVVGLLRIRLK